MSHTGLGFENDSFPWDANASASVTALNASTGGVGGADGDASGMSDEQYMRYQRLLWDAHLYLTPVIIVVGLLGNVTSFLVFVTTTLRHLSSSVYLAALALADTAFLFQVCTSGTKGEGGVRGLQGRCALEQIRQNQGTWSDRFRVKCKDSSRATEGLVPGEDPGEGEERRGPGESPWCKHGSRKYSKFKEHPGNKCSRKWKTAETEMGWI